MKNIFLISFLSFFLINFNLCQTTIDDIKVDSIRIYSDYTTINSQKTRYSEKFIEKVKNLIDSAVEAIRTIIMVPHYSHDLIIKFCHISVQTDITITTSGLPVDLILFPYIIDNLSTDYTDIDVYGIHCVLDDITGRPVAGVLGISENINLQKENFEEYYKTKVSKLLFLILF